MKKGERLTAIKAKLENQPITDGHTTVSRIFSQ